MCLSTAKRHGPNKLGPREMKECICVYDVVQVCTLFLKIDNVAYVANVFDMVIDFAVEFGTMSEVPSKKSTFELGVIELNSIISSISKHPSS